MKKYRYKIIEGPKKITGGTPTIQAYQVKLKLDKNHNLVESKNGRFIAGQPLSAYANHNGVEISIDGKIYRWSTTGIDPQNAILEVDMFLAADYKMPPVKKLSENLDNLPEIELKEPKPLGFIGYNNTTEEKGSEK